MLRLKYIYIITAVLLIGSSQCVFSTPKSAFIYADQFEFDGITHHITASGGVRLKYGDITVTGKKVRYYHHLKLVEIIGKVVVKRSGVVLYCQKILAHLKKNTIEAKGNINVHYLEYWGYASNALIDMTSKNITLSGAPFIQEGKDRMSAETIIMNYETELIKTIGKTKVIVSEETHKKGVL